MRPILSYIIWFSQRTGSTLLCQALASTGIAGKPQEWLHNPDTFDLCRMYKVDTPAAVQKTLWELGTTSNGVFGLKLSMSEPHHTRMLDQFRQFPGCPPHPQCRAEVWESAFPHCQHLFMTRRNKVRLAVSWWRAITSGEWHRKAGEPVWAAAVQDAYRFEAIAQRVLEASLREAAIQEFLTEGGIVPLTIVYEDFIADYAGTVQRVLDFLGVCPPKPFKIAPPGYEKLADEVSETWVQRFRHECQQGWKNIVW